MRQHRPLQWPDWETTKVYFGYCQLVNVVFLAVYCGGNWLANRDGTTFRFYMDWELSIPFVPAFIWIYCSLWVLFFVPLFQLGPAGLRRLAFQIVGATLAAGVVFVLFPADVGFGRPDALTGYAWLDNLIFHYNSVPSLHVIFSGLIVLALCEVATPRMCAFYRTWLVLIAAATVLTHQHHIADVLTAAVFVFAARRLTPTPAPPVLAIADQ